MSATASQLTDRISMLAEQARGAAAEVGTAELMAIIDPIADALDGVADLLNRQQRFLIELRNWKADA